MNPEYGIDCYRSRVRGPYARFCEKDKGPANYWALALLDFFPLSVRFPKPVP